MYNNILFSKRKEKNNDNSTNFVILNCILVEINGCNHKKENSYFYKDKV